MFTGIIEELAKVERLEKGSSGARLTVQAKATREVKLGDSINVNGACLTVTDVTGELVSFDVSPETLDKTAIGRLQQGESVNIERSLKADGRLGGHFVTGHVDCIGEIVAKESHGEFAELEIKLGPEFMKLLVEKGSVAVDGISLTVNKIRQRFFSVYIIPHTQANTTLKIKDIGDSVNVEVDLLAKYIQRLLNKSDDKSSKPSNITKGLLQEHGFI